MPFLFPPEAAPVLDSPERLSRVPVSKLLQVLKPKPGLRFLDIGCGTGTYFFPVFEAMQGIGVFLAAELQEEMLRRFLDRLDTFQQHPGFGSIEVLRAKPDRLPLPNASADLVLLAHVVHELAAREPYFREMKRVLAPGGMLCVLDWQTAAEEPALVQQAALMGPPLEARVSETQACAELQAAGFPWVVSHAGFHENWCLSARRPAP